MYKIIAIDDDKLNLDLIKNYLKDENFDVTLIADPVEGLDKILSQDYYDLVLLDKKMPKLDGSSVMQEIKSHYGFNHLPIIFQTGVVDEDELLNDIESGAYYYIQKPLQKNKLISLMSSCLSKTKQYRNIRNEIINRQRMLNIVQEINIKLQTPQEAIETAIYLSHLLPNPDRSFSGIFELLINGIEHGNLGITYEEKTKLYEHDELDAEVEKRLLLPMYCENYLSVNYKKNDKYVEINIIDMGHGFDWNKYMELSPERLIHTHGRGIAMAAKMSFDKLEYKGCGNHVLCQINIKDK